MNNNTEEDDRPSPFLIDRTRNFLFRNLLFSDSDIDWMCIICGFDNKPRNSYCLMCGTAHQFSTDYKHKKSERKRLQQESKAAKQNLDIKIPAEAQLSSVSTSLKYFSASTDPSLTVEERRKAINYRRLNQLTLRQKSARRRKMWQRRVDEATGALVWVRVPIRDTKVGTAQFGYTPRHSICSDDVNRGRDCEDASLLSGVGDDESSVGRSGHSMASLTNSILQDYDPVADLMAAAACPIPAAPLSPSNRKNRDPKRAQPTRAKSRTRSRDSFDDSTLLSHSPGFTSVFDEEGELVWERVEAGKPISAKGKGNKFGETVTGPTVTKYSSQLRPRAQSGVFARQQRLYVTPSFDRHTSTIGSVGSTLEGRTASAEPAGGALGANGTGTLSPLQQPLLADNVLDTLIPQSPHTRADAEDVDLAALAAMPYRSKVLWFLNRLSEFQVSPSEGYIKIEVRRRKLLEDSHSVFSQFPLEDMHKYMRVEFHGEPGVDAGGLEREWFSLVAEALFSPEAGLFTFCGGESIGAYHINPTSAMHNPQHLSYYRFVGRFIGKAILGQQSINANFSVPLRKQLLGMPVTFSDLEFVDSELFRNLQWMKTCKDVSSLMLDFTISYAGLSAQDHVNYELLKGGADITVTDENRDEYLMLRLRHRMLDSIKPQLEQMLMGLYEVIPADLLSIFDYQELDLLLCGVPDIDVEDWKLNTEYMGLYRKLGLRHKVICWFWVAVEAMSHEERIRLLQFITGCSRLPSQGFKALQSTDGRYRRFNIQSIPKTDSVYPRAHTCFNKLDLPMYDSQRELDAYLSVVINMENTTGFTIE